MPFNGAGSFSPPSSSFPEVADTLIDAIRYDAVISDLASGLTNAITKDGQTTITANIPMNGFKMTQLGSATARTDSSNLGNIQDGSGVYVSTVGGTVDAITLSPSPAIPSYTAGQTFRFVAAGANTTAVTVAVSGLTAKNLTKNGTTALLAGDIPAGAMVTMTYDGTQFVLNHIVAGAMISSGLTMADGRLLGRTSSGAGAVEEIAVDATLTLTAGTLSGTPATETQAGVIELATQAEVSAMTDTTRAMTANHQKLILATLQASTSGTSIDFTGLPSGVRRITVSFVGVSQSSTDAFLIQLGTSGGVETSGYVSGSAQLANSASVVGSRATDGFHVLQASSGASVLHGSATLTLVDAATFSWALTGTFSQSNVDMVISCAGSKALSAECDRVRVTTVSGTNTFDAGSINILYER